MKYSTNLIVVFSLFLSSVGIVNADGTSSNDGNVTALSDNTQQGSESYSLSLRAPKIDDNVFPVAVRYFDDLVNNVSAKNLKATLNVPLTLTIENSRKRRLLTLFTLPGDGKIPYGTNLSKIKQISLNTYADKKTKKTVLEKFVGPNKKIFRTIKDAKTYDIDFILPITKRHFNQGYVQVAIAASNGKELTQLCEITDGDCIKVVKFYIVPRNVEYKIETIDTSVINYVRPTAHIIIENTNVDLQFDLNNKKITRVNRKALPFKSNLLFDKIVFNPNLVSKQRGKVYVINVDMYPIIHYMSNKRYVPLDGIVATVAHDRPDLHLKSRKKGAVLTKKLNAMINGQAIPIDNVVAPKTEKKVAK